MLFVFWVDEMFKINFYMKTTLLFIVIFFTKTVYCQDSALIKKDTENIGAKVFELLRKMPKEEIKKMHEETYLISVYVKDSVVKSLELFSKPNFVLAASTNNLLQQLVNSFKIKSYNEKHFLLIVSIINSSRSKENRPKANQTFVGDFDKLHANLKNYGLNSSIKVTLSADKAVQ